MFLEPIDIVLIFLYGIALLSIALVVSREKKGHAKDTTDYFLASKALPWWAIGASLIAANISAEQIIGMSGAGYAIGLGIASYEWMAAITLIIVGKYFLPIFLDKKIYTMPQFLEQRFDGRVRTVMAIFWLGVYVFINLTSILWLGSLALSSLTGLDLTIGLVLIGVFATAYSLYGGMKAIALTDIIQVTMLVIGGFVITWITLDEIADGAGVFAGALALFEQAPEKFDMILSKNHPQYINLPGVSVLIGGLWIMNLSYWGFNQYIIQRALGAKSIDEARKGILFASGLKLLMPFIIVVPGIGASLLSPDLHPPDRAYPEMMKLAPAGFRGVIFAALLAAIVSSVGSMMNSIGTIFTMDIVRHLRSANDEQRLVRVGRIAAAVGLVVAIISAKPLLGSFDQAFQYIQEFTGFFTPGIVAIFLLGMFWKRSTASGALWAAVSSAVLSLAFRVFWPTLPFMDRVGLVFLLSLGIGILISLFGSDSSRAEAVRKSINLSSANFDTRSQFNIGGLIVAIVLVLLYGTFW